jgi:hypothetical protein
MDNQGITLIELLLSTVILSLIIIVSYRFWQYFQDSFDFTFSHSVSGSDVARISDTMARELRGLKSADNGAYALDITNDQELSFYANVDTDSQMEKVHYSLSGNDLLRSVINPSGDPAVYDPGTSSTTTLISGVVNGTDPIFLYYNGDWPTDQINNPLTASRQLDTRMITISLKVVSDINQTVSPSSLQNSVMLRSLKDN